MNVCTEGETSVLKAKLRTELTNFKQAPSESITKYYLRMLDVRDLYEFLYVKEEEYIETTTDAWIRGLISDDVKLAVNKAYLKGDATTLKETRDVALAESNARGLTYGVETRDVQKKVNLTQLDSEEEEEQPPGKRVQFMKGRRGKQGGNQRRKDESSNQGEQKTQETPQLPRADKRKAKLKEELRCWNCQGFNAHSNGLFEFSPRNVNDQPHDDN